MFYLYKHYYNDDGYVNIVNNVKYFPCFLFRNILLITNKIIIIISGNLEAFRFFL